MVAFRIYFGIINGDYYYVSLLCKLIPFVFLFNTHGRVLLGHGSLTLLSNGHSYYLVQLGADFAVNYSLTVISDQMAACGQTESGSHLPILISHVLYLTKISKMYKLAAFI
jgi:hypothetical protein